MGLIVSGNKYTGAAAVAEHRWRALGAVGVEARLLYVGGNNLQERLRDSRRALPGLTKERTPADLVSNLQAVRHLARWSDVLICHLPHDHFLGRLAGVHRSTVLVRSFSNPTHLRRDIYHRWLVSHISAGLTANSAMLAPARRLCGERCPLEPAPVPIEDRFHPGVYGGDSRVALEIPPGLPLLGMVGKVAPGRGFDTLLETVASLDDTWRVLIVGHGEARPELEAQARSLGLQDRVHWAGYQEKALPQLFAAMDFVMFAAPGSDHGHRAISEAQACGRPVVAFDFPGVDDLIIDGRTGRIVQDVEDAAAALHELLSRPRTALRLGEAASAAVAPRRLEPAGHRLVGFLQSLVPEAAP